MANDVIIYGLSDPRDGRVRYVGKTTQTLEARMAWALSNAVEPKSAKDAWILGLRSIGMAPVAFEIDRLTDGTRSSDDEEMFWIKFYMDTGSPLLNAKAGGVCGPLIRQFTADEKARLAAGAIVD